MGLSGTAPWHSTTRVVAHPLKFGHRMNQMDQMDRMDVRWGKSGCTPKTHAH